MNHLQLLENRLGSCLSLNYYHELCSINGTNSIQRCCVNRVESENNCTERFDNNAR